MFKLSKYMLEDFVNYVNNLHEYWNNLFDSFRFWCNWYKNKLICVRYPWLFINSGVYPWLDNQYTEIWIDCMPEGWRKRFGWKMVRDIDKYLRKHKIKDYHIDQVKEKWGELCWYDNGDIDLSNVIDKYVELSTRTCVVCGKEATHMSLGYICPYCEDCMKDILKRQPFKKFKKL